MNRGQRLLLPLSLIVVTVVMFVGLSSQFLTTGGDVAPSGEPSNRAGRTGGSAPTGVDGTAVTIAPPSAPDCSAAVLEAVVRQTRAGATLDDVICSADRAAATVVDPTNPLGGDLVLLAVVEHRWAVVATGPSGADPATVVPDDFSRATYDVWWATYRRRTLPATTTTSSSTTSPTTSTTLIPTPGVPGTPPGSSLGPTTTVGPNSSV